MDGGSVSSRVVMWNSPQDHIHPHQIWLAADREDRAANFTAFLAADTALSETVMDDVWRMHDSAQHHFIQMLLWQHPDGSHRCTINEAFSRAQKHHEEVMR